MSERERELYGRVVPVLHEFAYTGMSCASSVSQ